MTSVCEWTSAKPEAGETKDVNDMTQERPFECTVCGSIKPASEFRYNRRTLERAQRRRCKSCETCIECGKHCADLRMMAVDAQKCWACQKASKQIWARCTICKKAQCLSDFPESHSRHKASRIQNLILRCTACHICQTCKEKKDVRSFAAYSGICRTCTIKLKCGVCGQRFRHILRRASATHESFLEGLQCCTCAFDLVY